MSEVLQTIGLASVIVMYYALMLLATAVIPLGIPGEWGILLATVGFTFVAGSLWLPWWVSVVLFFLCVLAEGAEAVAGYYGARRAKGSILSGFGALLGGFLGALAGAPLGLFLGALVGAFAGTFAGAFLVEYLRTRNQAGSSNVAVGAVLGRVMGSALKIAISGVMIVLVTIVLLWNGSRRGALLGLRGDPGGTPPAASAAENGVSPGGADKSGRMPGDGAVEQAPLGGDD